MTTNDNDTDPSTPSARRTNDVRGPSQLDDTDPGPIVTPLPPRPSTDPGVAPPPEPRDAPVRPMGIVVPVAAPNLKKDSVELLLDGMTDPQPERTKTMPQTDGDASAAYHARHDVRAARTSPEDEPKVIIERQALQQTIRIDRAKVRELNEALVRAGARDPTAVLPPRVGPRIALAVVAGLVVVIGLFAALHASGRYAGYGPAPAAAAPKPPSDDLPSVSAAVAPPATLAPGSLETPSSSASSLPSAAAPRAADPASSSTATDGPHTTTPAASRAHSSPSASASARPPKLKPLPSASAAPDLGELKTTFH